MRRSLSLPAAIVALLVALVVIGCGGGDDATTTQTPASQSPFGGDGSPRRSLGDLPPAFVKCMADQGFQIQQEFDIHSASPAALQACIGSLHR
jgi:hypothetical protein